MLIDVYDFDGTIYDGDSTVDFSLFCLRRHPALLTALPRFLLSAARLAAGRIGLRELKSTLFGAMAVTLGCGDVYKAANMMLT